MQIKPEKDRRTFLAGALAAGGAALLAGTARAVADAVTPSSAPVLKQVGPAQAISPSSVPKTSVRAAKIRLKLRQFRNSNAMVQQLAKRYNISPKAVRGIMRATAQGYAAHLKSHTELAGIDAPV